MNIFCRLVCVILFCTNLSAEVLNLEQAYKKYLENNPNVQIAEANYEAARNEYKQGISTTLPEIDFVNQISEQKLYIPSINPDPFSSRTYSSTLQLTHAFFLGGRIWNTLSLKEETRNMAKYELADAKRNLGLGFIGKLYELESLKQKIKVVEESKKTQAEFLKITRSKFKRGNARGFELNQTEAEFYSYFPRIRQLKRNLTNLTEELKTELGDKDVNFNISLKATKSKVADLNRETLINRALSSRPDYKVVLHQLESAKLNKSIGFGEHMPSLSLTAQYGYQDSSFDTLFDDANEGNATSFGINLTIPIFSGLSSIYQRRANQARVSMADKGLVQKQRGIRKEVIAAIEDYKASSESIDYAKKWAASATKALKNATKSYRSGSVNSTQILQLQQSKERAQTSLIDAQVAHNLATLGLKSVVGDPLFEKSK